MSYRPVDDCSEIGRLIAIAEHLYDAIGSRDVPMVQALLDSGAASSLPRDVREEALTVVALPASSYRAPLQLLQLHHRLTQLARDTDVGVAMGQMEFPWSGHG